MPVTGTLRSVSEGKAACELPGKGESFPQVQGIIIIVLTSQSEQTCALGGRRLASESHLRAGTGSDFRKLGKGLTLLILFRLP